jgi:4-hydroxybenzoate polyprenyltransferase
MLGLRPDFRTASSLPFIVIFASLVFPPFIRAAVKPSPELVRAAVKRGVLALVAMDAAIAAGFGGWPFGIAVLALLPISIALARAFAVT